MFIGVVDALDGVLLDGDHGAGGAGFQILADVRVAEDVDGAVGLVDELFPQGGGFRTGQRMGLVIIFIDKNSHIVSDDRDYIDSLVFVGE